MSALKQPINTQISLNSTLLFNSKPSISGKIWQLHAGDDRQTMTIIQRYSLSPVIAQILVNRAINLEEIPSFLEPTLKQLMPDPSHLKDLDKGIERVIEALQRKEKIAVFGDYDVDGGTSCALFRRYFAALGCEARVYIPDRIEEGYGPSVKAMQTLKNEGHSLLLMADCGTTAFEPLREAKSLGLDVIVIDHHVAQPALPDVFALINPNRLDQGDSSLKGLCAAGLSFIFLVALQRKLRTLNWFENRREPDLMHLLDLVALGTVCDVMPLTGLNRAFVAQGLKVLQWRQNLGLAALADVAGVTEAPTAYHLGFVMGPRVNAGGRVGEAHLGSRLLSTNDDLEARRIAHRLDSLNGDRQQIEATVLTEAIKLVENSEIINKPILLVKGEGWHPGVIGIVASRLKERYARPVCVTTFTEDVGKGSGRSMVGIDLGSAMHAAHHEGLLIHGGGHAMAAGFTVARHKYDAFYDFILRRLAAGDEIIKPTLDIDASITLQGVTVEFLESMSCLEPFGAGNPTPKFMIQNVRIAYAEVFGADHVRCTLMSEDGVRQKALAFRVAQQPLGQALLKSKGDQFHVVGALKLDTWGGRKEAIIYMEDLIKINDLQGE